MSLEAACNEKESFQLEQGKLKNRRETLPWSQNVSSIIDSNCRSTCNTGVVKAVVGVMLLGVGCGKLDFERYSWSSRLNRTVRGVLKLDVSLSLELTKGKFVSCKSFLAKLSLVSESSLFFKFHKSNVEWVKYTFFLGSSRLGRPRCFQLAFIL